MKKLTFVLLGVLLLLGLSGWLWTKVLHPEVPANAAEPKGLPSVIPPEMEDKPGPAGGGTATRQKSTDSGTETATASSAVGSPVAVAPAYVLDQRVVGVWETQDGGVSLHWSISNEGTCWLWTDREATRKRGFLKASNGTLSLVNENGSKLSGTYRLEEGRLMTTKGDVWLPWNRTAGQPQQVVPEGVEHLAKGKALLDQQNYSEAIRVLTAAVNANPVLQPAWVLRAESLLTADLCNTNLSNETRKALGVFAFFQNDLIRVALADLDRALKYDPDDAKAHLVRGRCLLPFQRLDEAQQEVDAAVRLDPKMADAYGWRGCVKALRGLDGTEDMERCYALDPSRREVFEGTHKTSAATGAKLTLQQERRALADAAMEAWKDGFNPTALAPWLACGEEQTVKLRFITRVDETRNDERETTTTHYRDHTFRAVRVEVRPWSKLGPVTVYIPMQKADADAIPENHRIAIHAPPGVAALDPDDKTTHPGLVGAGGPGGRPLIGEWLDTMFATKGRVR